STWILIAFAWTWPLPSSSDPCSSSSSVDVAWTRSVGARPSRTAARGQHRRRGPGAGDRGGAGGFGLRCPRVEEALVARYLERFIREGLLPPPGARIRLRQRAGI